MQEESKGLPAAGSGQIQNASLPAEQQQGVAQPLTKEDVLSLFEEAFKTKRQSIADSTSARVQKVLDAAASKGVTLTNEQAQAVLDATKEEQKQNQAGTAATPPGQAQPQQPASQTTQAPAADTAPSAQDVTAQAEEILRKEYGLDPDQVSTSEPEFHLLDLQTEDVEKYKASVRAYGEAKKARLAGQGDPARLPGLVSRGGVSSTPAHVGKSGIETLENYYREKFGS